MQNDNIEYKHRILSSFPNYLKNDVEILLDILPIENNNDLPNISDDKTVILDSEVIKIPYRIHFDLPNESQENKLTTCQKDILNCIYLRHHNGFIRHDRLNKLANCHDYWVTPFKIQLLGEYIVEILLTLEKHFNEKTILNFNKFIKENPKYWETTKRRVVSYWNEYYRESKKSIFKNYIGSRIILKIENKIN
jgi:hypothetical protein